MPHLDDGVLNALLDGELTAAEQQAADGHLRTCDECAARLEEFRTLMGEADDLITAIEVPPVTTRPGTGGGSSHRFNYRPLAWAATIVLAVGLGYAANDVMHPPRATAPGTVALRQDAPASAIAPPDAGEAAGMAPERGTGRRAAALPAPAPGAQAAADRLRAAEAEPGPEAVTSRLKDEAVGAVAGKVAPAMEEAREAAPNAVVAAAGDAREGQAGSVRDSGTLPPADPAVQGGVSAEADQAAMSNAFRRQAPAERITQAMAPGSPGIVVRGGRIDAPGGLSSAGFRRVTMEEAVRTLGGVIRLVDGLAPDHVEIGGSDSTGLDRGPETVRVVYLNPDGTTLLLDQSRSGRNEAAQLRDRVSASASRESRQSPRRRTISWTDPQGFALSLSGTVSADSLARLQERVH
ncbi:MAG: anti-sigma factor [Gemmatimonadales bacterium]